MNAMDFDLSPEQAQLRKTVRSFAEKEPTLEDVFMMVTKGLVS